MAATVTALVVVVTVAAGVLWLRRGHDTPPGHDDATPRQQAGRTAAGEASVAAPPRAPARPPSAAPPPRAPSARLPAEWRATARAAIDASIAASGREVTEAERQEVLETLARIRLTAGRRGSTQNPTAAAKHARLVRDADRLFRETLGVGVAQFAAQLGAPGNVEDLGAAPP